MSGNYCHECCNGWDPDMPQDQPCPVCRTTPDKKISCFICPNCDDGIDEYGESCERCGGHGELVYYSVAEARADDVDMYLEQYPEKRSYFRFPPFEHYFCNDPSQLSLFGDSNVHD